LANKQLKYTGWRKKTFRTFACIIQPNGGNKSVQKHTCNDQTSSNMCVEFSPKHLLNKIALHAIKQFLQVAHHLRCCLYAGYAKTSQ